MQWSPCNTCVSNDGTSLGFISHLQLYAPGGGIFYNNLYRGASPEKGVPFSGFR